MAITAGFENFTAFLGHFVLNCSWDRYGADPNMTALFRWHGAEEMEHRTVAWDVVTYFNPSYWHRVRTMLTILPLVIWVSARFIWYLIANDPNAPTSRIRALYDVMRAGSLGLLPTVATVLGSIVDYLKPGFRPDDTGSMAQALSYLATVESRSGVA